jgi:hypothetical protein
MSDLLERAAAELIASPPREAPAVHELHRRLNQRRARCSAALGIVTVAVVVVGLVAISAQSGGRSVGNQFDSQLEDLGFDNDGTIPCGDFGCGQFDPIAVAPGVDDFYVGPASLGDPLISSQYWNATLRCAELDPAGATCTRIEGLGGTALVTYGDGVDQIQVGTTFSPNLSAEAYAKNRSISTSSPEGAATATTVRGHPAFSFAEPQQPPSPISPGLMWEERPNVIVWVTVPASRAAELSTIAEGLQTYVGPTSIPGRLVVPNTGVPWGVGVSGNNGSGLVIARFQGTECVAWGYIDSCDDSIESRTFVNPIGDATAVAGAVPPEVDAVRVNPQFGQPVVVTPFSYAGFSARFYQADLPQDFAQSVEWLAADGRVIDTYKLDAEATDVGWPVATAQVEGRGIRLSADFDTAGNSPDRSAGVGKYVGTGDVSRPTLCVYLTLVESSAVTCSSPPQLNLIDSFDGILFGAVDPDVASVLVDGQSVELRTSPEIPDRRFFVAAGSAAVFLDTDGKPIAVPSPIDRSQNP